MAGGLQARTFLLIAALIAVLLTSCATPGTGGSPAAEATDVANATEATDTPSSAAAPRSHETIAYYIDRLRDRTFVETYGGEENPRPWYTAAEALGEIGKPAIPALIDRLDTQDPYELMLALYALMLASQDPVLLDETNGDYLQLGTVLVPETNEDNRRRALAWWARHGHLWHER